MYSVQKSLSAQYLKIVFKLAQIRTHNKKSWYIMISSQKFKEQSWLTLDLVKDLQLFNHCAQV